MKWIPPLLAILYACSGLGIYAYIMYGEISEWPSLSQDLENMGLVSLMAIITGFCMGWASKGLQKILPWQKFFGMRFLTEMTIRMLIVSGILAFLIVGRLGTTDWASIESFFQNYQALLLKILVVLFFANIIFIIASFTFFTYNQFAIVQIQSVELRRKQLQLQFDMLRSQLSPHYLFNCLNTIANLVYKDANLAEEFIRRFAQTYQYVLNTHQKKLIPITAEIEFVQAFCFLLQTRFEEGIQLKIDLPETIRETAIPPLTLQILVENAVKHNVISPEKPLTIEVYAKQNQLCIKNSISEKPHQVTSLKVGLNNVKKRYTYFTEQAISIQQTENSFEVRLPLLKQETVPNPLFGKNPATNHSPFALQTNY